MSDGPAAARVESSGDRPAGAVFLSYASQDTDAARRICEALRTAGVEVWFDQNELVGGDAWDAKIRKQIRDCALFVPIISAATQARLEGYFRLEWKLAAQRTHTMAAAKTFLLPVVIDGTRDADAHVPEEFLAVQWTRLPPSPSLRGTGRPGSAGQAPDDALRAFCARVKKLLSGPVDMETGRAGSPRAARETGADRPPVPMKRSWLRYLWPAVGLIIGLIYAFRPAGRKAERRSEPSSAATAPAPVSEARKLVAQARTLFQDGDDANRENFFLAEDLLKRAVSLDLTDSEVWAAYGQLSVELYRYGFDRTPARLEAMRTQAERAVKLSPNSIEAQLAAAGAADYLGVEQNATEPKLRALAEQAAGNWRVLQALGRKLGRAGKVDESVAILARADELAGGNPSPWADASAYLISAGRYPEAETAVAKSLARRPDGRARVWDIVLKLGWRADVAAAAAALQQWPAWLFIEDRGASLAGLVWLWSRQPEKALALYQRMPREYLRDTFFTGPRAALTALAHEQSGHLEAALADWRVVAQLADRELAAAPGDGFASYWKAWALARLGDRGTAESIRQQLAQRGWAPASFLAPEAKLAGLAFLLGQADAAYAFLQRELDRQKQPGVLFVNSSVHYPLPRAVLELNPIFDPLRNDERFRRLLAQAPAPAATPGSASAKSVAVLAFANLSDDKANEFFSDGISEELLNVLAKVPGLKVSARTSAFYFKGKNTPIPEIAKQLGVAYVVEGSVRKAGSQVRITAQLIQAADGFHVWSDTFTRDLKDIFAMQDEIAGLIAKNLSLKLGAGTQAGAGTSNPEVLQLYHDARRAWNLRTPEGADRAEELLNRVLKLEPGFARAYAALADVIQVNADNNEPNAWLFGWLNSPGYNRMLSHARRAIALDPNCAEAYAALGGVYSEWQPAEAIPAFRRAIELNPNYATAHHWLGSTLVVDGRMGEALAAMARASELDPLSHRIHDNHARYLYLAGQPERALVAAERAVALQSDSFQGRFEKGSALIALGRTEEGVGLVISAAKANPYLAAHALHGLWRARRMDQLKQFAQEIGTRGNALFAFNLRLALGQMNEAFAPGARDALGDPARLLFDPFYDRFRSDPRFIRLLEEVGLAEAHARAQSWRLTQLKK